MLELAALVVLLGLALIAVAQENTRLRRELSDARAERTEALLRAQHERYRRESQQDELDYQRQRADRLDRYFEEQHELLWGSRSEREPSDRDSN